MDKKPIIIVKNVSKIYSVWRKSTLRITTSQLFSNKSSTKKSNRFYALRNVSFSVKKGEGVAIIGRNGSGKTTLLQLLANVMNPTNGSIKVDGRYTSLLGATLGFMPTMTGLDNIRLMAAMYGVRLDQEPDLMEKIIAFADIGDFMNTYVKNYSSGMKARIGFSVAIHVLPDIVFIDEVLGVGDIHFKKKCSGKISELKSEGRTFIIVTHNANNVSDYCERSIWLDRGEIKMDGPLEDTWDEYFNFKRSIRKYDKHMSN